MGEFRVWGTGFRVSGCGFRFRVWGLGFRVEDLGFRVSEPEATQAETDARADVTPGKKIRHWLQRGVPLLLTARLVEGNYRAYKQASILNWASFHGVKSEGKFSDTPQTLTPLSP